MIKWKRDNTLQELSDEMTKRQVFSWCGQAIGHFPVSGWLRPACSIVKRMVDGLKWDEQIDKTSAGMLMDIKKRLDVCEPVGGVWSVSRSKKGRVWCDASSLAIGVCL